MLVGTFPEPSERAVEGQIGACMVTFDMIPLSILNAGGNQARFNRRRNLDRVPKGLFPKKIRSGPNHCPLTGSALIND